MLARLLAVLALAAVPALAHAQSTAFTYQGRLRVSGNAASGSYDFRFRLYTALSGGTQLGSTLCGDNTAVSDGYFTATLDFGQQFATPNDRFLEIEVRQDTGLNCANAAGFTVLSPRQKLTPTPLADHATSAFRLDSANGSIPNALFVDNAGKVGIGTVFPTHTLTIASTAPTISLWDTDSTTNQVGYISFRDSANTEKGWFGYGDPTNPDLSIINARSSGDILLRPFSGFVGINNANPQAMLDVTGGALFSGVVGIGTAAPVSTLDVRGSIRFGTAGNLFPAAAVNEDLRIIRGRVGWEGSRLVGIGFSGVRTGEGYITVTFDTPFSGTPVVTATVNGRIEGDVNPYIVSFGGAPSRTGFTLNVAWYDGPSTDRNVDFIAIGPR